MRLKQIDIRTFRGIKRLNWTLPARESLTLLVGPGDAGKTTILDAIELVFTPRWNPRISESDFHLCDVTTPIRIRATVGSIPPELMTDPKFGLVGRGWSPAAELHDEPEEGDEDVLTVDFSISDDLEPSWLVVNDRLPEGKLISARDRALLASSRLDREVERHLGWGRGSALAAVTSSTQDLDKLLIEISRTARAAANDADLPDLKEAAERAEEVAKEYGAGADAPYEARLEAATNLVTSAAFTLHSDEVPLRQYGLGSRRLVSLALQSLAAREGAVMLVDEIENGLEPHRVRHLLQLLRKQLDVEPPLGQAIATTHSSVAVEEVNVRSLYVVRSSKSDTQLRRPRIGLQATVRTAPEALLAKRVLICEGKTEIGLVRGLEPQWTTDHGAPLGHVGTVPALGWGESAAGAARNFSTLGFPTALLADSDKPISPTAEELNALGVATFIWEGSTATEERVALDLPIEAINELLSLAARSYGEQSVRDAVVAKLPVSPTTTKLDAVKWIAEGIEEDAVRGAVGAVAKTTGWFKRIDRGQDLGTLIAAQWEDLEGSNLRTTLENLATWAYD